MTSRIKKLSPLLINQLAAGEVVTRPASVVKELLENAIDAGAKNITIKIMHGGMSSIEIADNGKGIHPDDMLMAVTRHATSKVANVEQLHGIYTLGFRGEALASIAAVSRLTLISSHDNSGIGRCLNVAGTIDDAPNLLPCVCEKGTQVIVKDLYFNVPARRANLKTVAVEYQYIESVIKQIALAYPDIGLSLYHDNKRRLTLLADHQTQETSESSGSHVYDTSSNIEPTTEINKQRLRQVLPTNLPDTSFSLDIDAQRLSTRTYGFKRLTGWLWIDEEQGTSTHKKTKNLPKLIYVNARLVKEPLINQQIKQTLQALSIDYSQAGFVLSILVDAETINLNIHPSKQRVNIADVNLITQQLDTSLHKALQDYITNTKTATSFEKTSSISYTKTKASDTSLPASLVSANRAKYVIQQQDTLLSNGFQHQTDMSLTNIYVDQHKITVMDVVNKLAKSFLMTRKWSLASVVIKTFVPYVLKGIIVVPNDKLPWITLHWQNHILLMTYYQYCYLLARQNNTLDTSYYKIASRKIDDIFW